MFEITYVVAVALRVYGVCWRLYVCARFRSPECFGVRTRATTATRAQHTDQWLRRHLVPSTGETVGRELFGGRRDSGEH